MISLDTGCFGNPCTHRGCGCAGCGCWLSKLPPFAYFSVRQLCQRCMTSPFRRQKCKNKDVGWKNNCSWHLLALYFAHCNYLWTSSGLEPAFLSFRKLTHPFNSTTVNCSGWYALTEALYVSVWSRHTRSGVFESPLGQVWSFFPNISLWTSANTSFCKIDTAFKLALFTMMWLHLQGDLLD